jgi:nicotinate phosphoribosyltransferase
MRQSIAADGPSWALLTDLYELTMAYGFWQQALAERPAVFYLSFREHPFGGSYTVAAGLATLCEMLHHYHFTASDLHYLSSLSGADGRSLLSREFLTYLEGLRLSCDIDAVPEGTVVFPHQPLVRVTGPLLQAQILESLLLNVINFQTLIATKAARICRAAASGSVLEFGLRRAQGESGALLASRAAYLGGCSATSNVLAGKRYDIPVRGTHAHSWVMAFDTEREAFERYARSLPNNCIFLVDTYDTEQGIAHAIEVAQQMRAAGHPAIGVRLDSGDLLSLSRRARQMLNAAGLVDAKVVASNDLDEEQIASLRAGGACIDIWGVGTRLATAYDQPALGGVYKLSALQDAEGRWQPKLKLSEQPIKVSTPGMLQTRRYRAGGRAVADVVYDELTGLESPVRAIDAAGQLIEIPRGATGDDLLVPVFRNGELVYQNPTIHHMRQRAADQLDEFLGEPYSVGQELSYPVGLERRLHELRLRLAGVATENGR